MPIKEKGKYTWSPMGKLKAVSNRFQQANAKLRKAQATCNRLKAEMKSLVGKL